VSKRDWEKDWELCQKAPGGVWSRVKGLNWDCWTIGIIEHHQALPFRGEEAEHAWNFIENAREALPYWLQQVRKLEERIEELEDVAFTVLRYLRANCASCDYGASFGSPSECNAGSCYAKEAYLLLSRVLGISDKF